MGLSMDRKHSRAVSGARSSKAQQTRQYPLRRVVDTVIEPILPGGSMTILKEVLECGHKMTPRQDMVGETNAVRRRCRQCWQEKTSSPQG